MTSQMYREKQLIKINQHAIKVGCNISWWLNGCMLLRNDKELIALFYFNNDQEFLKCVSQLIDLILAEKKSSNN